MNKYIHTEKKNISGYLGSKSKQKNQLNKNFHNRVTCTCKSSILPLLLLMFYKTFQEFFVLLKAANVNENQIIHSLFRYTFDTFHYATCIECVIIDSDDL